MNNNGDRVDISYLSEESRSCLSRALKEVNIDIANRKHPTATLRKSFYSQFGKRLFDIAISLPAVVISIPINIVLAVLTYRDVGRPIFFHQDRVGKDGKLFTITKFRSMTNETDAEGNLLPGEKRVTAFGQKIRSSSFDELFNFWNVLKGDMSIIGPRPLLPEYTDRYCDSHAQRLLIKPGLECPTPHRVMHALSWEEQFNNDVWYASNVSFITDCKLSFRMFEVVFSKEQTSVRGNASRSFFVGYDSKGEAIGLSSMPQEVLELLEGQDKDIRL